MEIHGKVSQGVVILDDTNALPDGTLVRVEPVAKEEPSQATESVGVMMRRLAGIVKGLPPDLARNHDHYLHGLPTK